MKSIRRIRTLVYFWSFTAALPSSGILALFSYTSESLEPIAAICFGTLLIAHVIPFNVFRKTLLGLPLEGMPEHPAFAEGPDKAPLFFLKLAWVILLYGALFGGIVAIGSGHPICGAVVIGSYGVIRLIPEYISMRKYGKRLFSESSTDRRRPGWAVFRILSLSFLISGSLLYGTYMRVTRQSWDYMLYAGILIVCLIPIIFLVTKSIGREFGLPEK